MRGTQPRSKLREMCEIFRNEKLCKTSTTSSELQQRLLWIVHPVDLPSKSAISKCIREDLVMTKKKIQQVAVRSKNANKCWTRQLFPGSDKRLTANDNPFLWRKQCRENFDAPPLLKCSARRTSVWSSEYASNRVQGRVGAASSFFLQSWSRGFANKIK